MKIEAIMRMTPKQRKDLYAAFLGYKRINPIKRTRKRQIAKTKHMLAWHDHTSYEWSQWWQQSQKAEEVEEMNKHGENIVLKVNKDKCLAGFYALGFEPKEIMGVLYQAITVLCKEQEVDPALQLMQLMIAAEERKSNGRESF